MYIFTCISYAYELICMFSRWEFHLYIIHCIFIHYGYEPAKHVYFSGEIKNMLKSPLLGVWSGSEVLNFGCITPHHFQHHTIATFARSKTWSQVSLICLSGVYKGGNPHKVTIVESQTAFDQTIIENMTFLTFPVHEPKPCSREPASTNGKVCVCMEGFVRVAGSLLEAH